MIVKRSVRWFDDRLRAASIGRKALAKVFPDNWSFALGEIALYCFVILVLTGTYLAFFFDPSTAKTTYDGHYQALQGATVSAAYKSTVELSYDVPVGLLMRQTHHWAAILFLIAIVAHLSRVFLTGAFRRPRELNWVIGVTLLLLAAVNGFAGYSMPDDLLSGTGLRVAYSIMLSVPLVGTWLAFLIFGGQFPGDQIVHRLYIAHVFLLPGAIAVLIAAHMGVLIRQKHSHLPGPGRNDHNVVGSRLYPGYAPRSLAFFFATAGALFALGGLAQINPVWVWGPWEPASATSPAQPDWYVGWVDGALRLFPAWEPHIFGWRLPNLFFPAVLLPFVVVLLLYSWPFLERRITGDRGEHQVLQRPRDMPARVGLYVATLAFFLVLLTAFGADVVARYTGAAVGTIYAVLRVCVFVLPPAFGLLGYGVTRALQRSSAPRLSELSWHDLVSNDGRPAAPSPEHERAAVEVWRSKQDHLWRWRYRIAAQSGEDELMLLGNEAFPERSAAVEAARSAYPEAPAHVQEPKPPSRLLVVGALAAAALGRRSARTSGALGMNRSDGGQDQ